MNLRTLKDVLWEAQGGYCWLCNRRMMFNAGNKPNGATLDHVWPKGIFGRVGDTGVCLLACRTCNMMRGDVMPTDDEIRAFVQVWRKIDQNWLRGNVSLLRTAARAARLQLQRLDILSMFVRA